MWGNTRNASWEDDFEPQSPEATFVYSSLSNRYMNTVDDGYLKENIENQRKVTFTSRKNKKESSNNRTGSNASKSYNFLEKVEGFDDEEDDYIYGLGREEDEDERQQSRAQIQEVVPDNLDVKASTEPDLPDLPENDFEADNLMNFLPNAAKPAKKKSTSPSSNPSGTRDKRKDKTQKRRSVFRGLFKGKNPEPEPEEVDAGTKQGSYYDPTFAYHELEDGDYFDDVKEKRLSSSEVVHKSLDPFFDETQSVIENMEEEELEEQRRIASYNRADFEGSGKQEDTNKSTLSLGHTMLSFLQRGKKATAASGFNGKKGTKKSSGPVEGNITKTTSRGVMFLPTGPNHTLTFSVASPPVAEYDMYTTKTSKSLLKKKDERMKQHLSSRGGGSQHNESVEEDRSSWRQRLKKSFSLRQPSAPSVHSALEEVEVDDELMAEGPAADIERDRLKIPKQTQGRLDKRNGAMQKIKKSNTAGTGRSGIFSLSFSIWNKPSVHNSQDQGDGKAGQKRRNRNPSAWQKFLKSFANFRAKLRATKPQTAAAGTK